MKFRIAMALFVGGSIVMVFGFGMAVYELAGMYSSALDNAMREGPDAKETSGRMLRYAIVGLIGALPATAGSIMLGKGMIAGIMKRMKKNEAEGSTGA